MTTPRVLLLLWSVLSLFIKAVQTPEGGLGPGVCGGVHRALSPSVWDSQALPRFLKSYP